MSELAQRIEALLFVAGEGLSISTIAKHLDTDEASIVTSVQELETHLEANHMITILRSGSMVSLVTAPSASSIVERFAKEEFAGPLTKAGLETLAIIAYKGPLKRSEVDYIRGVNSSFMIRNLLMRGLIERVHNEHGARAFLYKTSTEFLKFLGVTSQNELPEFDSFGVQLEAFIKETDSHEPQN